MSSLLTGDNGSAASLLTGRSSSGVSANALLTPAQQWVESQNTRYNHAKMMADATGTAAATHEGRGPLGLIAGALGLLDRPASAVKGLISGNFGLDRVGHEKEDSHDNGAERAWKALVHGEHYGTGDFKWWGRYSKDDNRFERILKGATDFGLDTATDPLTYLTFGAGGVAVKVGAQLTAKAGARLAAEHLGEDALRAAALRSAKGKVATEVGNLAHAEATAANKGAEKAAKASKDAIDAHLNQTIDGDTLRAMGVLDAKDLTGKQAMTFIGRQQIGAELGKAYLTGGPTAVRRQMVKEFGAERGEKLFAELAPNLKGGIQFRANPFGASTKTLIGGGGRTAEKLLGEAGADTFASSLRTARNWLRVKAAPVADHIGGDSVDFTRVLKGLADADDPKALTFYQFAQSKTLSEVKRQSFAGLNDKVVTVLATNQLARKAAEDATDEDTAKAAYTRMFEDRDSAKAAADGPDGWEKDLGTAVAGIHSWLDELHLAATDAGVDIAYIQDYLPRILTEDYKKLRAVKAPSVGASVVGGTAGPLKHRTGAFMHEFTLEDGTTSFKALTLSQVAAAMKTEFGESATKVFEDDPIKIIEAYGKAMNRVVSYKRMTNAAEQLGIWHRVGTDFTEGRWNFAKLNDTVRAADKDRVDTEDYLHNQTEWAAHEERKATTALGTHQADLAKAEADEAAASKALSEHRLARPSEADFTTTPWASRKPATHHRLSEDEYAAAQAERQALGEDTAAAAAGPDTAALEARIAAMDDELSAAEAAGDEAAAEQIHRDLTAAQAELTAAKAAPAAAPTPAAVPAAVPAEPGTLNTAVGDQLAEMLYAPKSATKPAAQADAATAAGRPAGEDLFSNDTPLTFEQTLARWESQLDDLKTARKDARDRVESLTAQTDTHAKNLTDATTKRVTHENDLAELERIFKDGKDLTSLVSGISRLQPEEQDKLAGDLIETMADFYRTGALRAGRDGYEGRKAALKQTANRIDDRDAFKEGTKNGDALAQVLAGEQHKMVRAGSSDTNGVNKAWAFDADSADLMVTDAVRDIARRHFEASKPRNGQLEKFMDDGYGPLFALLKTSQTVGRGIGYIVRNIMGGMQLAWFHGTTAKHFVASARQVATMNATLRKLAKQGLVGEDLSRGLETAMEERLSAKDFTAWRMAMAGGHFHAGMTLDQAAQLAGGDVSKQVKNLSSGHGFLAAKRDLVPQFADGTTFQKRYRMFLNAYPNFAPVRAFAKGSEVSEQYLRYAQFLGALDKYGDAESASMMVRVSQFDYDPETGMSDFERRVMRNLMPYWTWIRNSTGANFRLLAAQPGRVAMLVRAQQELGPAAFGEGDYGTSDDGVLPAWVERKFGFATGIKPDGKHAMTLSLESPINDLNAMFNADARHPVNMRQLAASLNPLLKLPIEQTAGVNLDTGASFQERGARAAGWEEKLHLAHKDENGVARISDPTQRALSLLLPPVGQAQNLIPGLGSDEQNQREASSLASYFGAPVSTLTDRQVAGEKLHRAVVMEDAAKKRALSGGVASELLTGYASKSGMTSDALAALLPQLAEITRQKARALEEARRQAAADAAAR